MNRFRIVLEVELKDSTLTHDDFIYRAVEEQLEPLESILEYDIKEITE